MDLKKNRYDSVSLKSGYEAMGQINLNFAEACLELDAKDLLAYENNLLKTVSPWAGDEDD